MNDFHEYQYHTRKTAIYPGAGQGNRDALSYTVLGLVGEAGEIANKYKKVIRDGADPDSIGAELGDVLWYLARIASELGLNLADIAEDNLNKLSSRKDRGVIKGSGDNR